MSRIFDVTANTEALCLDAQGRSETTFTVTNTSGRALRGRAALKGLGPTQAAWLSTTETERDFDPGGTHQFAVKVAVPVGAPAGKYSFRLDAVSVEKPDEDYTEGPVVSLEKAAAVKPAPFPYWILAVVALVLLGGGAAAFLLARGGGVAVPDVAGKPVAEARTLLTAAKLAAGGETTEAAADKTPGVVLRTDPKAGTKVKENAPVALVVAGEKAAEMVTVPNVVGLPVGRARETLQAAKITFKENAPIASPVTGDWTILYQKDQVIKQTPNADALVPANTEVVLDVAGETVKVPAVVGQKLPWALTQMANEGLLVAVTGDEDKLGGEHTVQSTLPDAQQPVLKGSQVTVRMPGSLIFIPSRSLRLKFQRGRELLRGPTDPVIVSPGP